MTAPAMAWDQRSSLPNGRRREAGQGEKGDRDHESDGDEAEEDADEDREVPAAAAGGKDEERDERLAGPQHEDDEQAPEGDDGPARRRGLPRRGDGPRGRPG